MRLLRVLPKIGLTIVLGVTIVPSARAGGTNDERFAGLQLYAAGQYRDSDPLLRPGARPPQARSRDLAQARLVLPALERAAECTR